jgi:hypothetical protein
MVMNNSLRVSLEALRGCLNNLEEAIRQLLQVMQTLPKGESRDRLLDEISSLDSIADVMRQALDSLPESASKGPEQ